jgi:hypothetical protein
MRQPAGVKWNERPGPRCKSPVESACCVKPPATARDITKSCMIWLAPAVGQVQPLCQRNGLLC